MPITAGTNQPDTLSASRWIGARLRWAWATIWTICASRVSAPTLSARITNEPVLLSEPATTLSPTPLVTGMDSPVTRDSSMVTRPSRISPSTATFSPGRDAQPVSDGDHVERDVLVAAVVTEPPRGLGRQIKQRPDGAGRLFAGAQLKNLAHQNQDGDDGRCLEIDRRAAVHPADRRREQSRRQHRDHAVDPGPRRRRWRSG